jgi:cytoskeleton protein RodZ
MPTVADDRSAPPPPALQDAAVPTDGRVFGDTPDARVVLRAKDDAWIQVRDNGGLMTTRLLKRGDTYRLPNRDGLTLMTGNAGGLIIELDGTALPALGRTGEVRRDVSLDISRLQAGATRPN